MIHEECRPYSRHRSSMIGNATFLHRRVKRDENAQCALSGPSSNCIFIMMKQVRQAGRKQWQQTLAKMKTFETRNYILETSSMPIGFLNYICCWCHCCCSYLSPYAILICIHVKWAWILDISVVGWNSDAGVFVALDFWRFCQEGIVTGAQIPGEGFRLVWLILIRGFSRTLPMAHSTKLFRPLLELRLLATTIAISWR